jgi:hypothetical protein
MPRLRRVTSVCKPRYLKIILPEPDGLGSPVFNHQ